MPSPVTANDFNIANMSGDLCEQLSQLLGVNARLKEWFAWAFNDDGTATEAFKSEFSSIGAPVGSVAWMSVNTVPSGWLLANGQAVSRTTYAGLFAVIGTNHGLGDGVSTFNVPNLSGKFLLGTTGTHPVGQEGGEEQHTLTVAELPKFSPAFTPELSGDSSPPSLTRITAGNSASTMGNGSFTLPEIGGDVAHNCLPPYKAGLWLIRY